MSPMDQLRLARRWNLFTTIGKWNIVTAKRLEYWTQLEDCNIVTLL